MRRYWKLFMGMFLFVFLAGTPAWAKLDLHGQVFYDAYSYSQDAEGFAGSRFGGAVNYTDYLTTPGNGGIAGVPVGSTPTAKDREQTYFDLNHATAIRAHWMNKEGLGAFFGMYMNADPSQASTTTGGSGGFNVGVSVALAYYRITPDLTLTVGKGGVTQIFSPEDPTLYMGYDGIGHVTGLGYGNINSKYQNNIRLTYAFNPNVSIDVGLMNPRLSFDNENYTFLGGPGFTSTDPLVAVENNSKMPKLEVSLPMKFKGDWGYVNFTPSAMYLKSEFENVQAGDDDSITSYGLAASTRMSLDNFKFRFEYNYGQNLANAARTGECQATPFKIEYINGGLYRGMVARVDAASGDVYDGKTHAFWLQAGYDISNKVTPTIFYGRNDSERDMPGTTADVDTTTQFYGIAVPIKVTKNLTISPEYMIYDNGDNNQVDGTYYNFGKESVLGVQMRLVF